MTQIFNKSLIVRGIRRPVGFCSEKALTKPRAPRMELSAARELAGRLLTFIVILHSYAQIIMCTKQQTPALPSSLFL